jgi:hypothetical protein
MTTWETDARTEALMRLSNTRSCTTDAASQDRLVGCQSSATNALLLLQDTGGPRSVQDTIRTPQSQADGNPLASH